MSDDINRLLGEISGKTNLILEEIKDQNKRIKVLENKAAFATGWFVAVASITAFAVNLVIAKIKGMLV